MEVVYKKRINKKLFKCTWDRTQIKKKYNELALKYHPDREGGDEDAMKDVNLQYEEALKKCKYNQDNSRIDEDDFFHFGKHCGEKIGECDDASYMIWMASDVKEISDEVRIKLLERAVRICIDRIKKLK